MKKSISVIAVITFLITLTGYLILIIFGEIFFEFDSVVHFAGGMFGGTIGMLFWRYLNRFLKILDEKALKILLISYSGFFAFIVGTLWEIAESYNFIHRYGPVSDTLLDLTMDVLGGIVICFWYIKRGEIFSRFVAFIEKILAHIGFLSHLYLKAYESLVEKEIKMAGISQRDRVIHIGCGAVPYTSRLIAEKTGASVLGIDNDPEAVDLALKYLSDKTNLVGKLILQLADARNFSISDFDVVIVSHTVKPQKEILKIALDSMKREARLIYRKREFVLVRKSMCIKSILIKKESPLYLREKRENNEELV